MAGLHKGVRIPVQHPAGVERETETVVRPWGHYMVLGEPDIEPITAVKKLVVEPGQALSLQSHRLRAERWMPLNYGLMAVIGDEEYDLIPGHVYDIGVGVRHRLVDRAGRGGAVVELIFGAYVESDIERYEDLYQRA